MNYIFPAKVLKLAEMLSGREWGSESYIARHVLDGEYANDPGLVFAWLTDLSLGMDCDKKCKSPNVRNYARIALRDLAEEFITVKSDPDLCLSAYFKEAQFLCAEKLLAELGLRF
jgi:hypothetical protein